MLHISSYIWIFDAIAYFGIFKHISRLIFLQNSAHICIFVHSFNCGIFIELHIYASENIFCIFRIFCIHERFLGLKFCAEKSSSKLSVLILGKGFGGYYLFLVLSAGTMQEPQICRDTFFAGAPKGLLPQLPIYLLCFRTLWNLTQPAHCISLGKARSNNAHILFARCIRSMWNFAWHAHSMSGILSPSKRNGRIRSTWRISIDLTLGGSLLLLHRCLNIPAK